MDIQDPLSGVRPGAAPGVPPTAPAQPAASVARGSTRLGLAPGLSPFSRQLAVLRLGDQAPGGPVPAPSVAEVTAKRGDTLTSLVRARWAALGGAREAMTAQEAHRWALQVAQDNGLANPDRIQVGQSLVVGLPAVSATALTTTKPTVAVVNRTSVAPAPKSLPPAPVAHSIVRVDAAGPAGSGPSPLLAQTLTRAVDLGYIPENDRTLVSGRIEALAGKHGFRPDDFAKAVLMESDGLNPRASNGRCHGIIQFCSGPDRGAASAGYGQQPQEILNLTVLQQLDLVDRYFDDTKLREFRGRDGQVRLDDLYLTILTPAARQERSLTAALPIAGPQALDLHVRRERQAPITRSSILAGLNVNAKARLGQFMVSHLMAR